MSNKEVMDKMKKFFMIEIESDREEVIDVVIECWDDMPIYYYSWDLKKAMFI